MNRLELRYTPVQPEWTSAILHGVVPYIDGVSLIDLIQQSTGKLPRGPLITRNYPQAAREEGLVEVLDCVCTDHGCGGVDAVVVSDELTVHWQSFRDPDGDDIPVGAFEFDAAQYDDAVLRINEELDRLSRAEA